MIARLVLFAAGFAASVLSPIAARAEVIWTFTETSCTSSNGGCVGNPGFSPLPDTIGLLTLPNINSSGHYSYQVGPPVPPAETGDTDFFFSWGSLYSAPIVKTPPGGCPGSGSAFAPCSWDITFASSLSMLTISIDFQGVGPNFPSLDIGNFGGTIGADGFMPGCGTFAECRITGFWSLASVPEPWSLDLLIGSLIAMFGFAGSLGRQATTG